MSIAAPDPHNKSSQMETKHAGGTDRTPQERQFIDNCTANEHEKPLSTPSPQIDDQSGDQQESRKAVGCEMENSIRVPAEFVADNVQSMTRSELLHHTVSLMLFSLGLGTLFIGPDVAATTPFTSTLLQIPALAALIGATTLVPSLNVPRWLQRGAVAAIYASVLLLQLPAGASALAVVMFATVAITAFLAPTVMQLSKASRVLAGIVVVGLVVAGVVV